MHVNLELSCSLLFIDAEVVQEVIKDSPSPSRGTIGPERFGEVNSECAAKVAPSFLANNSSECSPEGALVSGLIAESEAELIANIVDQGTIWIFL